MPIFQWSEQSDWSSTVLELMNDCVVSLVIDRIKQNPPNYIVSDDSYWLDNAIIECGLPLSKSSFELLAERLIRHYTKVRSFHACRPQNIDDYYNFGLIPLASEEMQAKIRDIFLKPEFLGVTEEIIKNAINKVGTGTRQGNLHLGLNDRHLITYCGHYLIYGSEYFAAIVVEIGLLLGMDLTNVLKNIGTPTIFICDIPIEKIDYGTIVELSGTLLSKLFESITNGDPVPSSLDFTITLQDKIEPSCIVSHYHPEKIPNPHDGYQIYVWGTQD